MNVVDSSGWLEYFADGPNATFFEKPLQNIDSLIVPTISIFEVFKKILQERDETQALNAIAIMQQGELVDLNINVAIHVATLSTELKLPMADSIMLSTAQIYKATFWTQDSDFKDIKDVKYIAKL